MNDCTFSHHAGGANTPQPVPPMPSLPMPPMQPLLEEAPPEITEPPLPGHFPFLGNAAHWH